MLTCERTLNGHKLDSIDCHVYVIASLLRAPLGTRNFVAVTVAYER